MVFRFFLNNIFLSNWSLTLSTLGQFFSLILIFVFILILTYYTTKILAKSKINSMTKGNIKIIETVNLGNSNIHIIKVGQQSFLVSTSKEGVRLISEINPENIKIKTLDDKENIKVKFIEYFNDNLGKNKKKEK